MTNEEFVPLYVSEYAALGWREFLAYGEMWKPDDMSWVFEKTLRETLGVTSQDMICIAYRLIASQCETVAEALAFFDEERIAQADAEKVELHLRRYWLRRCDVCGSWSTFGVPVCVHDGQGEG